MTADLRRLRHDVSRVVARRRALLVAGLVVAAVLTALPRLAPAPVAGASVLTAARDLPAGTTLSAADLVLVQLPRPLVPAGSLTEAVPVVGRLVAGPVRRGEALTDVRLLGADLLAGADPGLVASPVRLADPASTTLLRPGDRVDVFGASTEAATGEAPVVAADVAVLSVPVTAAQAEGALVVVATSPATAARLAAAAVSSRLSVAVRPR